MFVEQDVAGHWLVQESGGRLEGRFVSFATAMSFARAERHGFSGATVAVSPTPLVPQISFAPLPPLDIAARRAALPRSLRSYRSQPVTVATSRLSYSTLTADTAPAGFPEAEHIASGDHRWPLVVAALTALRETGRCSVRIVDADCRAGALLLRAVRHARALGFTAIEARGIDGAPSPTARAQSATRGLHDPAIGISFEVADLMSALAEEIELPADILLWRGRRAGVDQAAVERAVEAAGRVVIVDMPRRAWPTPTHRMTRRDLAWRSAGIACLPRHSPSVSRRSGRTRRRPHRSISCSICSVSSWRSPGFY